MGVRARGRFMRTLLMRMRACVRVYDFAPAWLCAQTIATWGGFLFYLLSALSRLESVQTVVYRGYPDKATVLDKYKVGRSAACNV
jgi:hypothetical protein